MFAELTKKLVKQAIEEETKKAVEKWGPTYSSLHEGYAVLKEEVEEAEERMNAINHNIEWFWSNIKCGESLPDFNGTADRIKFAAEQLALEACQIAAVCNKIMNGLEQK